MATGVGTSFDLDGLDKAIKNAEKDFENLIKTGQRMEQALTQNFRNVAEQGVGALIGKLSEAKQALNNMGGKSSVKIDVSRAVDEVVKLTQSIEKVGGKNNLAPFDAAMQQMMDKIVRLKNEIDTFKSFEGGNLLNTKDYEHIGKVSDELNSLMKQYAALDEARKKMAQSESNFSNHIDNVKGVSIEYHRQKAELDKLNEAYRTGTSELQKKAKTEIDAANNAIKSLRELQREYEKNAQANRQSQRQKNTSYEGALDFSSRAKSINREKLAIQYLTEARNNLSKADADYQNKLNTLNARIKQHNKNIQEATAGARELQEKHRGLMDTSGQLARAMAAIFSVSAIKGYVNKLMQIRGEFEMQQRSLQVLLQNKDEANALWDKTVALAVKSPFTTKQLVTYTKQLAAYRVESEKLYETNKMLADVSAGLGVDMNRLILAFGQVKAANFLRGTELRQFSEAGVNMLDELAKRFTALEGRAVSVGEVFERVSKRMVSFADVEAVFKTITSEGGVFYQMQEKQSETLKGMMLNLKDSYELMLNDIGKSNEGMLKGFVSVMKSIVDNWRDLAPFINTAGVALITYFGTGVLKGIAKYSTMVLNIWKAHPFLMIASILATAGTLIYNLITATDELSDAMHEVEKNVTESLEESIGLYRKLTDTINDSTKSLDERNKAYEELKTKFKDILPDQQLELKYIQSLKFSYKEAEDAMFAYYNAKAIQQKKDKIESIYEGDFDRDTKDIIRQIKENIDDIDRLTDEQKIKMKSGVSRAVYSALEELKKGNISDVSLTNTGLAAIADNLVEQIEKNLKEYSGDFVNLLDSNVFKNAKELAKTAKDYKDSMSDISGLPFQTYEQQQAYNAMQEHNKEMENAVSLYKHLVSLRQKLADNKVDLTSDKSTLNVKQLQDREWYLNDLNNTLNEINKLSPEVANGIKDIDKSLLSAAKKGSYEFAKSLGVAENALYNIFADKAKTLKGGNEGADAMLTNFAEVIKANAESKLATPLQQAIISAFDKAINDKDLSKKGKDLLAKLLPDEKQSTGDVRKLVEALLTQYRDEVKKWENSKLAGGEQLPLIQYINQFGDKKFKSAMGMFLGSDEEFNELQQKVIPVLEHIDRLLGGDPSKGKNGRSRDLVDERLRVIKEIYKAYKELNKTFDKTISKTGAMEKFGDAFYSAFGKTPEQMGYNLFTAQGVVDAYNKFISTLSKADDITKGNLAKGEFAMELQVEMQQNKDKDFQDEIERMFSGYELSLELEKLNIPRELVESLSDVDTFDLSDIRAKLEQELYRLQVAGGYEDQIKKIQEFLKKVSKMEQKEQEDRLKEYIEFARGTLNERVKIKLEELSKIKKIEKAFKIESTDTYEEKRKKKELETAAKERARKEADAAIQKLDWEDFKSSDTFNIIFDDLEHASDEVLKNIIQQLKDFKNQWKDMPFEQMRQVVDLLQKAEGALGDDGNPFARAKRLKEAIKEDGRSAKQAQLDVYNAEERKKAAEAALANYEIFKKVDEKLYDSASMSTEQQKEYVEWQKLSVEQQKDLVEEMQDEVSYQDDVIQKGKKQLNNIQALKNAYDEQANIIKEINGLAQSLYSSFKDIYEALGGDGDSINMIFADMAMAMLDGVVQATTMWLQFQALKLAAAEFGITLNSALGVIGLAVQAISLLAMAFTAFSKAHDKSKEKQIEKEMSLVKHLQRIYEDLGETIKNVYAIDALNEATRLSKENLIAQINATERMIAAEEGKKKTDQSRIEDWKSEIEDYKKAIQELEETRLQELGAFASDENKKSGAEAFLDAWMEAYKQTGDGLSGLNEQFDEFFEDMVKKQMLQRGANKFLEPFFKQFDSAIDKWSTGGITDRGMLDEINEAQEYYLPQLNKFLTSLAETLGVSEEIAGSTAELGGLSVGISGITEDQADILAAYWSSVRLYTSDTNAKVTELVTKLFSDDTTANPMLSQLKAILAQTTAIRDLFDSVVGHGNGGTHSGAYLKVAVG